MRRIPLKYLLVIFVSLMLPTAASADPDKRFTLEPNDHIVIIGNTFAERMALSGYFDALAYASHPNHQLVIRNVPWSADEVALRPREMNVPTMEDHLTSYEADVIVMSFGMSESFKGASGLGAFEKQLDDQLTRFASTSYNGTAPPKLVLISPITHEDLGTPMLTGRDLKERNNMLGQYVQVMQRAAQAHDVRFIDLFEPSSGLYQREIPQLTSNGIHPNELGYFHLVQEIAVQLRWMESTARRDKAPTSATKLRRLAYDKHYHHKMFYRPTNTEYVFGRRHKPYGVVNFPAEREQLLRMIEARERAIWEMDLPTLNELFASAPKGPAVWENIPTSQDLPEDTWDASAVKAKGNENSLGDLNILSPEEFAKSFTLADGYSIDCFASEQDFEELQNPLAMTFDARGRLWVLCTPTYPHLMPGEAPRCKLLIIEDTDGDGKADKRIIFADQLYIPTGFAIDTDAVYIGQAPDLWKFTDTNGDDRADRREIVASGFGMPDSHHQISAFEWDPNGGILFHEGVFTKSNVETPYGTKRTNGAAVWRYDPRTQHLQVMSHCNFSNPWGHAFDDYGQSVLADASGGDNYSFSHVIMPYEYPNKPKRVGRFLNRGRPTAGCELISSRHFPDDVQDSFLVNQSIGFHGTRWSQTALVDSAWTAEAMPQDLLQSTDTNFRPVAMEIGPDGALYIADWCNPLVGHMQYSVRDPRRDHTHGRIWRIYHTQRPLVSPPTIEGTTVVELLELLRLPERNTRQIARRRLQTTAASELFPALIKWMAQLDNSDPLHDRLMLEALWIHQAHGRVDLELAYQVATLAEPRTRAGAVRVLRHWLEQHVINADSALPLLQLAVEDEDMRVRLEGVLACGFYPGISGASVAAVAAELVMDEGLRIVLQETLAYLAKYGEPQSEIVKRLRLERTEVDDLLSQPLDEILASVMLLRSDIPQNKRVEALTFLASDSTTSPAQLLVAELIAARQINNAIAAIAPLLLDMTAQDLSTADDALKRAASSENIQMKSLAIAALMRIAPENAKLVGTNPTLTTEVLKFLTPEQVPDSIITQLRQSIDKGLVDSRQAIEQVVRYWTDDTELFTWLAQRIDAVSEKGLHEFNQEHGTAMAALRAMNMIHTTQWPQGFDNYHVEPVSDTQLDLGRAIYFDEINGCVRCHGVDGRGEEGFPPLDRSPWVLGAPRRAAAIVIHGLYGKLSLSQGQQFNSVMEPLGANLDDEQIVDVLSYIRQSWGNYAPAIAIDDVRQARQLKPQSQASFLVETLSRDYPLSRDRILASNNNPNAPEITIVNPKTIYMITGSVIVGLLVLIFITSRFSAKFQRKMTS